MVVVHGQVHAAAGDAGLVREDGQRGLVLAVVPPVRARRCLSVEIKFRAPHAIDAPLPLRLLDFHGAARCTPTRAHGPAADDDPRSGGGSARATSAPLQFVTSGP